MTQIERIFRIHRYLQSGVPVTLARITAALEVSSATFNRDLQKMRDYFGAPIVYDHKARGYAYDRNQPKFELPGFWLNPRELHALMMIQRMFEDMAPGVLSPLLQPLEARIGDILGLCGQSVESLAKLVQIQPLQQRPLPNDCFSVVMQGLLDQKQISIVYHSRSRDEVRQRLINPQRLLFYKSNWYLLAWCQLGEGLRTFALDRINRADLQDSDCVRVPVQSLDEYCQEGFGLWRGDDVASAVLKFQGPGLSYIADEIWHERQKGEWNGQEYILSLPFSNPDELLQEIMRHGSSVTVLEPSWLKDLHIEKLKCALKQYGY